MQASFCRSLILAFAILWLGASAMGSPWKKLTRLNIRETIQVPGAILPPGNYVVRLADSDSNRHIVQFLNEEQSKIYTTALAIPNELKTDEVSGDTQLVFYETRGNAPPALRAWFYPGDKVGHEFVYSRSEAQVLTGRTGRYVPSIDDEAARTLRLREDVKEAPVFEKNTRIYVWTPENKEGQPQQARADNMRRDLEQAWREQQRDYRRYGAFTEDGLTNPHPSTASPSEPQPGSEPSKSYAVSRDIVLPVNIHERHSEIDRVMNQVESHGDAFASELKAALKVSTIPVRDREEFEHMANRLESLLDNLEKQYKRKDFKAAHDELRRALEIGASVNRYMLRSEFGKAERTWRVLRQDLNALAAAHTFPAIEGYTSGTIGSSQR